MEKDIMPEITNIKQQDTFTLPSRGLLYKPEDGIPEAITLRRMTTAEEKLRYRSDDNTQVTKDLLNACIVSQVPVDCGKLKLSDANFLLFKLRVLSLLTDKYKVTVTCPHCGAQFIHEIHLSDVPVDYLTDDIKDKLKVTLPISKQTIDLDVPNLNKLIKLGETLEEFFDRFPNVNRQEKLLTETNLIYIDKVNGKTLLAEEKEDYINSMDIVDFKTLRKAINKLSADYGLSQDLKTLCPKCKSEVTHGLPITYELFNPSDEDI